MTLNAIRPLIINEDAGRTHVGEAEAYRCANPLFALKRAAAYDRQCEGYGDFRVFNTTTHREVRASDFLFDAHCRSREAALCNDFPF